jgi:hypothetical protein
MGIEDCSNVQVGTLRWNSYESPNLLTPMLWWLTFCSFVIVLLMVEYSLLVFFIENWLNFQGFYWHSPNHVKIAYFSDLCGCPKKEIRIVITRFGHFIYVICWIEILYIL